jgi:2'-5' RNA ligase
MPASPEAWRCFVAVPVPSAIRAALEPAVAAWRSEPGAPDLRWTDPDGWHVTLAFLGTTDPDAVAGIRDTLAGAVRTAVPFVVQTAGAGAFPRAANAQSVWLGIDDPAGRLAGLAHDVQVATLDADLRRPLHPHLTLGRSRARRGEPLAHWLDSRVLKPVEMAVDGFVLYRSHLSTGPARYEELARLPLGGAGSGGG